MHTSTNPWKQDLTPPLAESFDLDSLNGAIITNLVRDGPADKAGLNRGDVITYIDDIAVNNVHDLLNTVSQVKPGTTITVKGIRAGEPFAFQATVIQRPVQEE